MSLKIGIIGAGLGGLAAATALTREGHDVTLFEQSGFSDEVGAAIHIPPNAIRLLQGWGYNEDVLHAVSCECLNVYTGAGQHIVRPVVTEELQTRLNIPHGWLLTHRVDLHRCLRALAENGTPGNHAKINLKSRVSSVEPEEGLISLTNGETHRFDLIVGADGVHSQTAGCVNGYSAKRISTGQNCFRFLVPVEKINDDPSLRQFIERIGLNAMSVFVEKGHKLVLYPCRSGTLINAVAFYPVEETDLSKESSWLAAGSIDKLLAQFDHFGAEIKGILRLAEDLKLWSLASREPLHVFNSGRLVVLGDAAHPTLPHQGQGGAQALEDAAALGALFTSHTRSDEVVRRGQLYNQVRYDRSVTVMLMSSVNDDQRETMLPALRKMVPNASLPPDMFTYCWPSRPDEEATNVLALAGLN